MYTDGQLTYFSLLMNKHHETLAEVSNLIASTLDTNAQPESMSHKQDFVLLSAKVVINTRHRSIHNFS